MGKVRTYSLSDYTVSIKSPEASYTISTTDNNVGSISWSRKVNMSNVVGDAAGGAVLNINKDKTGTITLTLSQKSPYASDLTDYFNHCAAESPSDYICDIIIEDKAKTTEIKGYDCFPTKLPDEELGAEAGDVEFSFEVGNLAISKK